MKVETDIITNIGRIVIDVIMYFETFKMEVIAFIGTKRHMLRQTDHYFPRIRATKLILTISLSRIKGNMSSLPIIKNNA